MSPPPGRPAWGGRVRLPRGCGARGPAPRAGAGRVARGLVRVLALGIVLAAVPSAGARAGEPAAPDPRLERADALLASEAGYDQAIALYREVLAEQPGLVAARQQLARVLAWKEDYDASLQEYATLLSGPAPPADAAVEQAEVLSWAGRTDAARAAFEKILAAHPDDARAARGLARVYRWSGDRARADAWYARALALEDDKEARQEWQALRAELKRGLGTSARWFQDSDDFTYVRTQVALDADRGFDTHLKLLTGTIWARYPWPADSRYAGGPEEDRAYDARLVVDRRLDASWKGTLELGGRLWEHGTTRPLGRLALEYTPDEGTTFDLELRHDDLIERSFSLGSALRGIGDSTAAASAWRQLSQRFELWAGAEGSLFTDGNGQESFSTSLDFRPWHERQITVGLATGIASYRDYSQYYYSPSFDTATTLGAKGRLPIYGALALTFDVGAGLGYAVEHGNAGFGPEYHVKGGLAWSHHGFTVALDGAHSESQRSTSYTTQDVQLSLGWSF
jgi:tetratricopeptide (TPR) repeat protein